MCNSQRADFWEDFVYLCISKNGVRKSRVLRIRRRNNLDQTYDTREILKSQAQ